MYYTVTINNIETPSIPHPNVLNIPSRIIKINHRYQNSKYMISDNYSSFYEEYKRGKTKLCCLR